MKNMKIKQKETTDIYSHDFKNFNEVQFESELCNIDWKSVLEINKKDVDFSFSKFFETFNNLLQKHAPIKKNFLTEIKNNEKNMDHQRNTKIH